MVLGDQSFKSTTSNVFKELKKTVSKALKGTIRTCLTNREYKKKDRNCKKESSRNSGTEKDNRKKLTGGTEQHILKGRTKNQQIEYMSIEFRKSWT